MKFLETKQNTDSYHLYTSIGGVQTPTQYNDKFRGILWSQTRMGLVKTWKAVYDPFTKKGKLEELLLPGKITVPLKVKDFDTFEEAYTWHIDKYIENNLVWC